MDKCGVCGNDKPWHDSDEVKHEFNLEGHLVKKTKPKPTRPAHIPGDTILIRLISVLAEKRLLDQDDLFRIFPPGEGSNASSD